MATLRRLAGIAAVAAAALAFPGAAGAANYLVGKTTDGPPMPAQCVDSVLNAGQCSLREAITTANANGGPDVVTLQAGATYTLSQSQGGVESGNLEGDLDITDSLTIEGNGGTVDGSGLAARERVLEVLFSGSGQSATVRDLTVTGGRAQPSPHGPGGGISVHATNGSALLERMRVTGNRVVAAASTQGAGVSVSAGSIEIRDSLIDGNVAETPGTSTGGIIVGGGNLTITNSTVTGNADPTDSGGIRQFAGSQLHLRNATVAGNTGNLHRQAATVASSVNSIVASPASGANCTLNGSTWATSTGNVSSTLDAATSGCNFGTTSATGVDPGLTSLGDNGGPTQTMALVPGSPAIDAGSSDPSLCPATDQRGQSRPNDGNGDGAAACDAGAFEAATLQPPTPPPGGGGNPGGGDPVTPVLPGDVTGPGLRLRGSSRQAPLRRRNSIVYKATSTENGTLAVGGSFKVPGDRRTYRFEPVTRIVTAGRTVTIKLLIPRRALSGVKRILRRGRRMNVSLTFTATDAAGNRTSARRKVKLARR